MPKVHQMAADHFAFPSEGCLIEAKECARVRGGIEATVKVTVDGVTQALNRFNLTRAKARTEFAAILAAKAHPFDEDVLIWLANAADEVLPIFKEGDARDGNREGQGQAITYEDIEPWPDPVVLASVLAQMLERLNRYVILSDAAAVATVLWCAHTYMMEAWAISPFLTINSPVKQCGKTTLLGVVERFVRRPQVTSSITEAALYRLIELAAPTLMIDEAENCIDDSKNTLYGVLNAGHTRRTAKTIRTVGDEHEPREFSTWAPKVVVLIGKLKDTLMDRSIVIPMRRRRPSESVAKLRVRELRTLEGECLPLRQQLTRWATDNHDECITCTPALPDVMRDRVADNWEPLLAIAQLAGGDWLTRAHRAAIELTGDESIDDSAGMALLKDCFTIYERDGGDVIKSNDLCAALNQVEPWKDARKGKGLSATFLANKLKPFDVTTAGTLRFGPETAKGYRWSSFLDPWERYLNLKPSQRNKPKDDGPESVISSRHNGAPVTDAEMAVSSITTGVVTPVTVVRDAERGDGAHTDGDIFEL